MMKATQMDLSGLPGDPPIDYDRVQLMWFLAPGPKSFTEVRNQMAKVDRMDLAKTIADAANDGLVRVGDEGLSLTSFGQRVLKSF